jgi:chitinase
MKQGFLGIVMLAAVALGIGCAARYSSGASGGRSLLVAGYWHNWQDEETGWIALDEIPEEYDRVIVSFALPKQPWDGTMVFAPDRDSDEGFRASVARLQARGTKVLIAIGGSAHPIELNTAAERDAFVASMLEIIDAYGFDGLDVNLEGRSLVLDEGDLDFRAPTSPKIVHLIEALRSIKSECGRAFLLTFAPETLYTVGGYGRYGDAAGGYLPVLHALRNELDAVHLQLYNSGSQFLYMGSGAEDQIVEQGSIEFVVGLSAMLAHGFPVNRDAGQFFEGLGPERIFAGLPAHPSAAPSGGYLAPERVKEMLQIATGQRPWIFLDEVEEIEGQRMIPVIGGVMLWSINWDAKGSPARKRYETVSAIEALD